MAWHLIRRHCPQNASPHYLKESILWTEQTHELPSSKTYIIIIINARHRPLQMFATPINFWLLPTNFWLTSGPRRSCTTFSTPELVHPSDCQFRRLIWPVQFPATRYLNFLSRYHLQYIPTLSFSLCEIVNVMECNRKTIKYKRTILAIWITIKCYYSTKLHCTF